MAAQLLRVVELMTTNSNAGARNLFMGIGATLIVGSILILGLTGWEAYSNVRNAVQTVQVPGFRTLKLDRGGLYAGVYQHAGVGEFPVDTLSHLDVRVLSQTDYTALPVNVNAAGQVMQRFGMTGMPVFSFLAPSAGEFAFTAVYTGNKPQPQPLNVMLMSEQAANVKQTLIAGVGFFLVLLGIGIFVLLKLDQWAPAAGAQPSSKRK